MTNNANNATHYMKLGKKRLESTGPSRHVGPIGGLIGLKVSSLRGSRLCRHKWCTQGAGCPRLNLLKEEPGFNRPVELGDLKYKWK